MKLFSIALLVQLISSGSLATDSRITKDFLKDAPRPAPKKMVPLQEVALSTEDDRVAKAAVDVAEKAFYEMMATDQKLFKKEFDRIFNCPKQNLQCVNKKRCK